MAGESAIRFDPALDLKLERDIDVPPARVWACWTQPELLMRWFCPLPWKVTEAEIDLRPGGLFRTVMRGPNGEAPPAEPGCFLEVVPERRLVFTDALGPGFRPRQEAFMTGVLELAPLPGGGTRYVAMALHADAEARARHAAMGFDEGWGKALDQLVALARTL
jgi:uncharacterized protein YndB with AHSA1/START domain